MLNLTKLALLGIALSAMIFTGSLISNHNKYKATNVFIPTTTVNPTNNKTTGTPGKTKVTHLNLRSNQVILLNGEINTASVESAINQIQAAETAGADQVYVVLDCPGGSVFDGARLIAYMDASSVRINTVVYGLAASMCGHIFSHGKTRLMVDHATLMMHQASGGVQGNVKGMKSLLGYIDRVTQKLDAYVADRSKLSREDYDKLVTTDLWIDATDAVDVGLADGLAVINVEGGVIPEGSLIGKTNSPNVDAPKYENPLKDFTY